MPVKWARAFGLSAIVIASIFLGYLIGSNIRQPQVVTVAQPLPAKIIEVPVEVVKEVEVIKEVVLVKEVEVVKEVPLKLGQFDSFQELEDWLGQVDRRIPLKPNSEGVIKLHGICDDVAIYLQDRAIEDGYKMSIEVLGRHQYYQWYGKWLDEGLLHAVNSVIIGNEFWFIDFLGDKIWVGAYLDD